jgi:hypothetical protein
MLIPSELDNLDANSILIVMMVCMNHVVKKKKHMKDQLKSPLSGQKLTLLTLSHNTPKLKSQLLKSKSKKLYYHMSANILSDSGINSDSDHPQEWKLTKREPRLTQLLVSLKLLLIVPITH